MTSLNTYDKGVIILETETLEKVICPVKRDSMFGESFSAKKTEMSLAGVARLLRVSTSAVSKILQSIAEGEGLVIQLRQECPPLASLAILTSPIR